VQKASADRISDFELRISDFGVFFFNPHSAIYIPQFQRPARSRKWKPPHGFCAEGPWRRAWHRVEGHLQVTSALALLTHGGEGNFSGMLPILMEEGSPLLRSF